MMERVYAILIAVFCAVSIFMVAPFDEAIIFGLITAYGLRMLADKIAESFGSLFSETAFLGGILAVLAGSIYWLISSIASVAFEILRLTANVSEGIESLLYMVGMREITSYVTEIELYLRTSVQQLLFNVATDVPWMVLQVFAYGLVVFYGFTQGPAVWQRVSRTIDRLSTDDRLLATFKKRAVTLVEEVFVVYGLSAVILTVVSATGFYLLGHFILGHPLPFWWFWALLVGVCAFLPVLASGFFLFPMVIYYAGAGKIGFAISLAVFSLLFLWIFPETVLRPWLGTSQMDENYLVLVIGFTAGVLVFGPHGMVTGPVLVISAKDIVIDELG